MQRRRFLAAGGALVGLAGCLGDSGDGQGEPTATSTSGTADPSTEQATTTTNTATGPKLGDDLPSDPDPDDGYPPAFESVPPAPSADPSSFRTTDVGSEAVSLAPIDVVYAWYARGEARFVDARGHTQWENSHVLGAVSSPASGRDSDEPVSNWPTDDRIVCYCGCPHHLSAMRAAQLQGNGYTDVHVIDEGFWEWHGRRYPMAGANVENAPAAVEVDGVVDRAHAGEYARARHPPTGQLEAAPIDGTGRYSLELRFAGVDGDSPVVVETPDYEVSAPLDDLASGVVRGGAVDSGS